MYLERNTTTTILNTNFSSKDSLAILNESFKYSLMSN